MLIVELTKKKNEEVFGSDVFLLMEGLVELF